MNINCQDRERIYLGGSAEEWTALESHAAGCPECAEEIRAWKALSISAEEMRDYQDDPALWAKIEKSLRQHERRQFDTHGYWESVAFWRAIPLRWQMAFASALAVVLTATVIYVVRQPSSPTVASERLLKNSALAEVERTQREYMKAIDQLAAETKPQLDSPASPLMVNYREKLIVLDSAIGELREEAGRNPSNAHLRYQLLAMYQEKQETLREVLETKR